MNKKETKQWIITLLVWVVWCALIMRLIAYEEKTNQATVKDACEELVPGQLTSTP
jgi:preprotein translocase subunit YajC